MNCFSRFREASEDRIVYIGNHFLKQYNFVVSVQCNFIFGMFFIDHPNEIKLVGQFKKQFHGFSMSFNSMLFG